MTFFLLEREKNDIKACFEIVGSVCILYGLRLNLREIKVCFFKSIPFQFEKSQEFSSV